MDESWMQIVMDCSFYCQHYLVDKLWIWPGKDTILHIFCKGYMGGVVLFCFYKSTEPTTAVFCCFCTDNELHSSENFRTNQTYYSALQLHLNCYECKRFPPKYFQVGGRLKSNQVGVNIGFWDSICQPTDVKNSISLKEVISSQVLLSKKWLGLWSQWDLLALCVFEQVLECHSWPRCVSRYNHTRNNLFVLL